MRYRDKFRKYKKFYFERWRGKECPSPAFGGNIIRATRSGLSHVVSSPKRSKKEILRRVSLVKKARKLIEESTFVQLYEKKGDIEYWVLQGVFEKETIRVIVRSVKGGNKHFFSVFPVSKLARKTKTRHKK